MNKYTCPMHPEIISDTPGRCPKCGMALVEISKATTVVKDGQGLEQLTWHNYIPLIVIIVLITIVSAVSAWGNKTVSGYDFILHFMTGFFLVFSGFKLMDIKGFAEGYSTYDLLAKKWFGYGYIYPFLELGFGLLMLAQFHPTWLLWTEFSVMLFSGIGVAIKLAKGERFQCACLGTFLKVPLTKITLLEDFGMAIFALILIYS